MCAIKSSHVPLYKTRTIESYPNRIQFRRNKKHTEGDILGKYLSTPDPPPRVPYNWWQRRDIVTRVITRCRTVGVRETANRNLNSIQHDGK